MTGSFVFEVNREEATKIAWKIDPNHFGKLEEGPTHLASLNGS